MHHMHMHHGMMMNPGMMNPGMMHHGMHGGHLVGPPAYAVPGYGYYGYWPWVPYFYNAPTGAYRGYGAGNYRTRSSRSDIDLSDVLDQGQSTSFTGKVGDWIKKIPWAPVIGGLGGMWVASKLLGSWGAGMWDSLWSVATVALAAVAGAIVVSKGIEILNGHGAQNRFAAAAMPSVSMQAQRDPAPTRTAGNMDRAMAQFKNGGAPASPADNHHGFPTSAPNTPLVAKPAAKTSATPTVLRT